MNWSSAMIIKFSFFWGPVLAKRGSRGWGWGEGERGEWWGCFGIHCVKYGEGYGR